VVGFVFGRWLRGGNGGRKLALLGIDIEANPIGIPTSQSEAGLDPLLLRYRTGFGIGTNLHSDAGHVGKLQQKAFCFARNFNEIPCLFHTAKEGRNVRPCRI
jgi:hypothetical protein